MKKEEINELIKDKFKKINKYFHKAIDNFEAGDIREFRSEIKKLKVFLHLISMESEDGLSCHITKRMRTMYGYLGIIQNLQLQMKKTSEYAKKSSLSVPGFYMNSLEKEIEYWKKSSGDFIDPAYNFLRDEYEILAALPGKLTKKSIIRFINYTLYELQAISVHRNEEALNDIRKFLEDIYYNLPFIKPFITRGQTTLFDEKQVSECLRLLGNFLDKSTAVSLLRTFNIDALDGNEKQIIKQMEFDWLDEKKEMKVQLASQLDFMRLTDNHLREPYLHE